MAAKLGTPTGSVATVKPALVAPAGRGSTAETLVKTLFVVATAVDPLGAGALSWIVPAEELPKLHRAIALAITQRRIQDTCEIKP